MLNFDAAFQALTGHPPLPWQRRLYSQHFLPAQIPSDCSLPTGLGKTSVVAIWLIALANGASVPRRLVYVVNRRTVVDQTTDEVERYATAISENELLAPLKTVFDGTRISTLRGQRADNGLWCEDPSRAAVICGTVDMIGSRLLFSGYGIGRKSRPLHAGFLGQDALLIHDEAHLEPAFQKLIEAIQQQQRAEAAVDWPQLQIMALTATSRNHSEFGLDDADYANPVVQQRCFATKQLQLHALTDSKKPAKELAERALTLRDHGGTVLVYASTVETVLEVHTLLKRAPVPAQLLTGTMRGFERDQLVHDPVFTRFLLPATPPENPPQETAYLVCTSAGEVGVNLSADHMVCDLSPFDSMAQRLGRLNRFGVRDDSTVHVLYPATWDDSHPLTPARQHTLQLLRQLNGSANSAALATLPPEHRAAAFSPQPRVLPLSDSLFDAWSMTTIREKLPGRPDIAPYLHGISDAQAPETTIAWRDDVQRLNHHTITDEQRTEVLVAYPLLSRETLREPSVRALRHLEKLAADNPEAPAWLVDPDSTVQQIQLDYFLDRDNREEIFNRTIILAPATGGLQDGMLNSDSDSPATDVSATADRGRSWDANLPIEELHEVLSISLAAEDDDLTDADASEKLLVWYARRNTGEPRARRAVSLQTHTDDVVAQLQKIITNLPLTTSLKNCLITAAHHHDSGKRRAIFQRMLGNTRFPEIWLAKGRSTTRARLPEHYRHEFGSLHDLPAASTLQLTPNEYELVQHLIATHHGRARPHFPKEEAFDPAATPSRDAATAAAVTQRFGRLQKRFGRWGLAWLESLLRAADWAASAQPSEELEHSI
jgi:CRISPR-associated endonuclease/helicase Cas3